MMPEPPAHQALCFSLSKCRLGTPLPGSQHGLSMCFLEFGDQRSSCGTRGFLDEATGCRREQEGTEHDGRVECDQIRKRISSQWGEVPNHAFGDVEDDEVHEISAVADGAEVTSIGVDDQ